LSDGTGDTKLIDPIANLSWKKKKGGLRGVGAMSEIMEDIVPKIWMLSGDVDGASFLTKSRETKRETMNSRGGKRADTRIRMKIFGDKYLRRNLILISVTPVYFRASDMLWTYALSVTQTASPDHYPLPSLQSIIFAYPNSRFV